MNRPIKTICQMCYFYCGLDVYTQNNHIERIAGMQEHPVNRGGICPKGLASQHLTIDPQRLKKPLKRKGPRGSNNWEEISWEAAMEEVAERIACGREKYGAPSIGFYRGQAPGWVTSMNYATRFMNTFGSPNMFTHGHLCFAPRAIAHRATYGGVPEPDFEKAKCIMLWGFNPVYTSLPNYGRRTIEAKKRGAKLIVIDPRFTKTAAKADLWLRPKPGTDIYLAMGMVKTIIDEKLYNEKFIKDHTIGWEQLAGSVATLKLSDVEMQTGVALQKIKEAARMFALNAPAVLKEGNGTDQHVNVVQTVRAISLLIALTGSINEEGGNILVPPLPFVDVQARACRPEQWQTVPTSKYPLYYENGNSLHGNELLAALETQNPYKFHSLIIQGGDPVAATSNTKRTKRLLANVDFIITHDLYLTAAGEMADFVLPAASFLERDHLLYYRYRPSARINMVAMQNMVVPPVGESRSDLEFIFELGQRLGLHESFPWTDVKDAFDWELSPLGITTDYFREHPAGYIKEYTPAELFVSHGRTDFPTPSKKVELSSQHFAQAGHAPVPEPRPVPKELATSEKYPLLCATGLKLGIHTHTQFQSLQWIEDIEPEPFLEVHPQTVSAYKLKNKQLVRLSTPWGNLEVPVRVTKAVDENTVMLTYGWGQPYTGKKWDLANKITPFNPADPISGATSNRRIPCNLEPVQEPAEKAAEELVLIADLDLCVGCYACEVACAQQHGKKFIQVDILGPEEDTQGNLTLECIPRTGPGCNLCRDRLAADEEPACVQACPTGSLQMDLANKLPPLLKKQRIQICRFIKDQ